MNDSAYDGWVVEGGSVPLKFLETSFASRVVGLNEDIAAAMGRDQAIAAAVEAMDGAICAFDRETRLIFCNSGFLRLYRLSADRAKAGTRLSELEASRAAVGTHLGPGLRSYLDFVRALEPGHAPRAYLAELKDGRSVRIRHHALATGGFVAFHDDQTQTRDFMAGRSDPIALQTIIDLVPDYLWVKDLESRFVVVNRALASHSGFADPRNMIGLSDHDIHASDAADAFRATELQILQSGEPMIDREESVVDPSGAQKWLLSTKTPLTDAHGEIYGLVGIAHDVTERVRAKSELRRAQEFLSLLIENVPEAILVKDVRTRKFTMLNRAAEALIGSSRADILDRTADAIYPEGYIDLVRREDEELLQKGELFLDNHHIRLLNNESRIVSLTRKLLRDDDGEPQFMLTVIHDVTDRKRAEERIEHLASHDPLTDLPNRFAFNARLREAVETTAKRGARLGVLVLDLDRLKEVNDAFGHAVGDLLLCEIANRLRTLTGGAFLARLGGDEYGLIVDVEPDGPHALAERLLAGCCGDVDFDDAKISVGMSLGGAIFPDDGADASTLLANADAALFRAKAEGRGGARFFKREMDKRLRERHAMRRDLGVAIERGELSLCYQPQADVSGRIVGFEALLRWRHPQRGNVSPAEFIPIAEESRLIVSIGEWALRAACREAASWERPLSVAVNLSPVQFQRGDLPALVHSVLLETGLSPNRLELEITDGVLIDDSARGLSVLRRLKSLGVRIAMDDFGSGYSSLSYLQSFPFDKIKIDRAFVSNVTQKPQSAAIVKAVLGLARGLGLPVLAEGVETREELAFLAAEACDEVQGYLIGRPQPISAYADWIGAPERRTA